MHNKKCWEFLVFASDGIRALLLFSSAVFVVTVASSPGDEPLTAANKIEPMVFELRFFSGNIPRHEAVINRGADKLKYFGSRRCGKSMTGKWFATIRVWSMDADGRIAFRIDNYPSASKGDVVPLFGAIARLGEVTSDQGRPGADGGDEPDADTNSLFLTTISAKELGCQPVENCLTIPVQTIPHQTYATRFEPDWKTVKYGIEVSKVEIVNGQKRCNLLIGAKEVTRRSFHIGDTFQVDEQLKTDKNGNPVPPESFKIKDIVIPDPARQVIGWVTLQPMMKDWPATAR